MTVRDVRGTLVYRLWVWQHDFVKAPLCDLAERRGWRWRCTECRYNERAEHD